MKTVTGNTYPVKDEIKALGGKWNAQEKCWEVPDKSYAEALKLVAGAGEKKPSGTRSGGYSKPSSYRSTARRTGCSCGSREGVYQDSDCWQCKHDAD